MPWAVLDPFGRSPGTTIEAQVRGIECPGPDERLTIVGVMLEGALGGDQIRRKTFVGAPGLLTLGGLNPSRCGSGIGVS